MECVVHLEEPCDDNCSACCESSWHHRAVMPDIKEPLCFECYRDRATSEAADRRYQAAYAYASGYED